MSVVLALDISRYAREKTRASGEARCDCCGLMYRDFPSRLSKAKRHYCSRECQMKDRHVERNPNWRGGMAERKCGHCGSEFKAFVANVSKGEAIYCSRGCKRDGQRKYPDLVVAHREHSRRRETRQKAGRSIKTHTYAEWISLLERSGHRCSHCGVGGKLTRDHVMPLSKGGHDGIDNIQPLCHSCNCKKGNRIWL